MNKIYKNPILCLILLIIAIASGLYSITQLPVALYPAASKPQFSIRVSLDSLSPDEFYNNYYTDIFQKLDKVDRVESIETNINSDAAKFNIEFTWKTDSNTAQKDLDSIKTYISTLLPPELKDKIWLWRRKANGGFFTASIYKEDGQFLDFRKKLEKELLPKMKNIEGVDTAFLWDPQRKSALITLNPKKILQYQIDVDNLLNYLKSTLYDKKIGQVSSKESSLSIIFKSPIVDYKTLRHLSLDPIGKTGLVLKDIADVDLKLNSKDSEIVRTNGKSALILRLQPNDEANLKYLSETALAYLKENSKQWPEGSAFEVIVDPSKFINSSIKNVSQQIIIGGFIAVFILMLFVGSIRNSIFAVVEIPIALIMSFIIMRWSGVSINLISLGGLALTAGMNIDSSIVMVENILRHLKLNPPKNFEEKFKTILIAVEEVKWPIITSCVSSLIVFFPLIITEGLAYAVLGDLAKAVIFSHGFSVVVSLVVVPLVRIYVVKSDFENKPKFIVFKIMESFISNLEIFYSKTLNFVLSKQINRNTVLISTGIILILCLAILAPNIKKELIKMPNTDMFWVDVEYKNAATIEDLASVFRPLEIELINEHSKYVKSTFTQIWNNTNGGILVILHDKDLMKEAEVELKKSFEAKTEMTIQLWPWNPSSLPIPNPPPFNLRIFGEHLERNQAAIDIEKHLKDNKKMSWIRNFVNEEQYIELKPKSKYLENYLKATQQNSYSFLSTLRNKFLDSKIGSMETADGNKEVLVSYPEYALNSKEGLANLALPYLNQFLPLRALIDIDIKTNIDSYFFKDNIEMANLHGALKNTDDAKLIYEEIKNLYKDKDLNFELVDSNIETDKALLEVSTALGISILLIFILLYIQFNSFKDVAIILCSFPLGLIGVCISLWALDSSWSINSGLGVILLAGISVNNSILLISFIRQNQEKFTNLKDNIIFSAQTRLKPILVTSLTTILAMIPIAFGRGDGGEVLQSMGIAVSGGMIVSTFLTLIIIPSLFYILEKKNA